MLQPGTFVLAVHPWSPLYGHAHAGNALLSVNGDDAISMNAQSVATKLDKNKSVDRELVLVSAAHQEDDEDEELLKAVAEEASTKSSFDASGFI